MTATMKPQGFPRYSTLPLARRLTSKLRAALAADQRTRHLRQPRASRPEDSNTGGHCVALAHLDNAIDVELWLDLYAGLASPRTWIGFATSSRPKIDRLARLATNEGPGDSLPRRYSRDVHRRNRIWLFKHPLASGQFDVQLLEIYPRDYYLGVYLPYPWPLTPKNERAVVRQSLNYIATLANAYISPSSPDRGRLVRWGRPDKEVEDAAIRYVKAKLKRAGYKVRSREHEICGYDLHATRSNQELHVEVKGVSGERRRFFITRTELKEAKRDQDWRLAVVLRASSRPHMGPYISGQRLKQLYDMEPSQWFVTARTGD